MVRTRAHGHTSLLQCLERGILQNQLFDDPGGKTLAFLRSLVGGFLRVPAVKQALMSDALRSRFLAALKSGVARSGAVPSAMRTGLGVHPTRN